MWSLLPTANICAVALCETAHTAEFLLFQSHSNYIQDSIITQFVMEKINMSVFPNVFDYGSTCLMKCALGYSTGNTVQKGSAGLNKQLDSEQKITLFCALETRSLIFVFQKNQTLGNKVFF